MPHSERQSNFELLRIVAIALVILHHMLIATGRVDYRAGRWCGMEWLNALAVVGVNCFVLISGYFGIRLRAVKVIYLLWLIAGVVMADGLLSLIWPAGVDFRYAALTIVPFVKGSNWFITCYFALMAFAPLLNAAIAHMRPNALRRATAIVVGIACLAYFTGNRAVGAHGYGLVQLLVVYLLGASLRNVHTGRAVALGLYMGGALAALAVARFVQSGYVAFSYNSPWVLASSAGLFLFFKDLKFHSRFVNGWAQAVFTTFLLSYAIMKHVAAECTYTFAEKGAKWILLYVGTFAAGFLVHRVLHAGFCLVQRYFKKSV